MKYYFINKSINSVELTQSSGVERREIQTHVQKRTYLARKSTTHKTRANQSAQDKVLTIDWRLSGECDPFCSASICLDAKQHYLLYNHVKVYLHPCIWIHEVDVIQGKAFKDDNSMIQILKHAIEDSLVMNCILCVAASVVRNTKAKSDLCVSEFDELHFAHNAYRLLRDRLSTTQSRTKSEVEMLASCIGFLLASEIWKNEEGYSVARTHLKAEVLLLNSIGGVMQMENDRLRSQLHMSDIFLGTINMEPCLHRHDYDPGPLCGWTKTMVRESKQTVGTMLLRADGNILTHSLWMLVFHAVECYRAFGILNQARMKSSQQVELSHWVNNRSMALLSQLLALVVDDQRVDAMRITVILWMVLWTNSTPRSRTPKKIVVLLDQRLSGIESSRWLSNIDVYWWILCMGYSCAEGGSSIARRFKTKVCETCWSRSELWLSGKRADLLATIEEFLNGFLYHSPVQCLSIQNLASSISLGSSNGLMQSDIV